MKQEFNYWADDLKVVAGWTRGLEFQYYENSDELVGVFADDDTIVRIEWRGPEEVFESFCEGR